MLRRRRPRHLPPADGRRRPGPGRRGRGEPARGARRPRRRGRCGCAGSATASAPRPTSPSTPGSTPGRGARGSRTTPSTGCCTTCPACPTRPCTSARPPRTASPRTRRSPTTACRRPARTPRRRADGATVRSPVTRTVATGGPTSAVGGELESGRGSTRLHGEVEGVDAGGQLDVARIDVPRPEAERHRRLPALRRAASAVSPPGSGSPSPDALDQPSGLPVVLATVLVVTPAADHVVGSPSPLPATAAAVADAQTRLAHQRRAAEEAATTLRVPAESAATSSHPPRSAGASSAGELEKVEARQPASPGPRPSPAARGGPPSSPAPPPPTPPARSGAPGRERVGRPGERAQHVNDHDRSHRAGASQPGTSRRGPHRAILNATGPSPELFGPHACLDYTHDARDHAESVRSPAVARHRRRAGGDGGTRTPNPRLAKAVLYQLSYVPGGHGVAQRRSLRRGRLAPQAASALRSAPPPDGDDARRRAGGDQEDEPSSRCSSWIRTAPDGSAGWAWEDLNLRPHPYQGCALTV